MVDSRGNVLDAMQALNKASQASTLSLRILSFVDRLAGSELAVFIRPHRIHMAHLAQKQRMAHPTSNFAYSGREPHSSRHHRTTLPSTGSLPSPRNNSESELSAGVVAPGVDFVLHLFLLGRRSCLNLRQMKHI